MGRPLASKAAVCVIVRSLGEIAPPRTARSWLATSCSRGTAAHINSGSAVANHEDTLLRGRKMLTTSPVRYGRQARLTGVVAVLSLMLASLLTTPAEAAEPVTYKDHVYSSAATAATADKPQ